MCLVAPPYASIGNVSIHDSHFLIYKEVLLRGTSLRIQGYHLEPEGVPREKMQAGTMQEMSTDDNYPHLDHDVAGNSSLKINSDSRTCLSQKMCDADINAKTEDAVLSKEFHSELTYDWAGDRRFYIFSAVTDRTRHVLCRTPVCKQMNVKLI